MTSTALYLRQSFDRTDDSAAVDRQRTQCRALAARKGWAELVEYVDNDVSATARKPRPAYQRLLKDIADGRVCAVVCWDLDRLHRRPVELEEFMALADGMNVALATASGEVDLSTAQGRLLARVKGSVAAHEVEHKSARQRAAARQAAEKGVPKWRTAFGYTDERQPHPVEAELVRKAYDTILGGGSLSGVAREWNAAGHYGRTGKAWSASTMSLFLRSPRNAALRAHNGEIVGPGVWAALVEESTWRAAQAVLNDPARKPGPKTCRRNLLTGLLRCGKCGGAMAGQLHPTAAAKYACRNDGCRSVSIVRDDTEVLVQAVVVARLARADAAELLIDRDAPNLDELAAEANALRARLDELAIDFADGELTSSQLRAATGRLTTRLAETESAMASATSVRVFGDLPLGTDRVGEAFGQLDVDRRRAIIDTLLTATVMPVGKRGRVAFNPDRIVFDWRR